MLSITSDSIMFESPSKLLLNVLVICGSYIVLTTVGGWCILTVSHTLCPSLLHTPTTHKLLSRRPWFLCTLTQGWCPWLEIVSTNHCVTWPPSEIQNFMICFTKETDAFNQRKEHFEVTSKREFKVLKLWPLHSVALLRNVPLRLPCSSMKNSKPSREENVPLQVPPSGLFFMSRVKSGLCLIRRHGCPRKPESHDAASSPQSTVSTLEEEEGLGTQGKSTVWCFLFGAASNPVITGQNAFLTCDLPHNHVRRFISSPAHGFFFTLMKWRTWGLITPSTAARWHQEWKRKSLHWYVV